MTFFFPQMPQYLWFFPNWFPQFVQNTYISGFSNVLTGIFIFYVGGIGILFFGLEYFIVILLLKKLIRICRPRFLSPKSFSPYHGVTQWRSLSHLFIILRRLINYSFTNRDMPLGAPRGKFSITIRTHGRWIILSPCIYRLIEKLIKIFLKTCKSYFLNSADWCGLINSYSVL